MTNYKITVINNNKKILETVKNADFTDYAFSMAYQQILEAMQETDTNGNYVILIEKI